MLKTLAVLVGAFLSSFPAIHYFADYSPPYFPKADQFVAGIGLAVFCITFFGRAGHTFLPRRIAIIIISAVILVSLYSTLQPFLTVEPPPTRDSPNRQIGLFPMHILTEGARKLIEEKAGEEPPYDIDTPELLMRAFSVWSGEQKETAIWPFWSIFLAGYLLVGLFLLGFVLWAYGLGALGRFLFQTSSGLELRHLVRSSSGHFEFDSGHHGDLWLNVDDLFVSPRRTQAWASELAHGIQRTKPDVVCGVEHGGMLLGQLVAAELEIDFIFALPANSIFALKPVSALHRLLSYRRVIIVDVIVSSGTMVSQIADLIRTQGGEVVGIACLFAAKDTAVRLAAERSLQFQSLETIARNIWTPQHCPKCHLSLPLEHPTN